MSNTDDWVIAADYYVMRKKLKSASLFPLLLGGFIAFFALVFTILTFTNPKHPNVSTLLIMWVVAAAFIVSGILSRKVIRPGWLMACSIVLSLGGVSQIVSLEIFSIIIGVWLLFYSAPGYHRLYNRFAYLRKEEVSPEIVDGVAAAIETVDRMCLRKIPGVIEVREKKGNQRWKAALVEDVVVFVSAALYGSDVICCRRENFKVTDTMIADSEATGRYASLRFGPKSMNIIAGESSLKQLEEWALADDLA